MKIHYEKRKSGRSGWQAFVLIILLWQLLSVHYPSILLPSPLLTVRSLVSIAGSGALMAETAVTLQRLLVALAISVVLGTAVGIAMGKWKGVKELLEPAVYFIQAVPPILYMTIAMIWFGLNGRATIFIVCIGSIPIMVVSIQEGFENIDADLLEMGRSFAFSRKKLFFEIILPSLGAYFKTGLITVFGLGWKMAVMGEVLSASTGLGARITDARVNLETNMVFAWGLVVILLCYLFQKLASTIGTVSPKRRGHHER